LAVYNNEFILGRACVDSEIINWLATNTSGYFGDFGLRDTFQERIALKPIEIDIDKLRMEILALNVDYDGLGLDFLGSRKPAHKCIKELYPRCTPVKVVILPMLASLSWK